MSDFRSRPAYGDRAELDERADATLAVIANTYSHVMLDEAELDYRGLLAV